MPSEFKKVPAIEKCFAILQLFSRSHQALRISDVSKQLELNKSTVFNIVYTLKDLKILEQYDDGKFHFGTLLYLLGNSNGKRSELIQTVRPHLERINRETKLSAFLGIRSDLRAVIIDKADTAHDIKISSEIGMRLPLLAGAGGKALLCQLSDDEIELILRDNPLKPFTRRTCTDPSQFKKEVLKVRKDGFAVDNEEYIDGIVAFAVPLKAHQPGVEAAVWAVSLKQQVGKRDEPDIIDLLKKMASEINLRFS